jgi:hypothetical protein
MAVAYCNDDASDNVLQTSCTGCKSNPACQQPPTSLLSRIRWSQELVVATRWYQVDPIPIASVSRAPHGSHDHHRMHIAHRRSRGTRTDDTSYTTADNEREYPHHTTSYYHRLQLQQLCSLCVSSSSSLSPCSLFSLSSSSSSAAARSPRPSAFRMNCSIA